MAIMDRRIARAATRVCGNVDLRVLERVASFNACRFEAIADARGQLARVSLLAAAGGMLCRYERDISYVETTLHLVVLGRAIFALTFFAVLATAALFELLCGFSLGGGKTF